MTLYNSGLITFENEIDKALRDVIEETLDIDLKPDEYPGMAELELIDEGGDIEECLRSLIKKAKDLGNPVTDIDVNYYGDYEGGYCFEDGELKSLSAEEYTLRQVCDDDLIAEIKRRGLSL